MKLFFSIIMVLWAQSVCAFVPFSFKWPVSKIPLPFYIQPSVSQSHNSTIQNGYNVWSLVPTTIFEFVYAGTSSAVVRTNDGINVAGFGTQFQMGNSLAVCWYWYFGADMIDADIEFNSNIDWINGYDLMTVAIHEAGHALGLDHPPTTESIMYWQYQGTRQTLYQDDIDGISSIYPGSKSFAVDTVYQNAPNPFVPNSDSDYTVIGYSVKEAGPVKLELYNLAGELVKVLVDEYKDKGVYIGTQAARWYGDNGLPNVLGKKVASGVYIAALKTSRSKVKLRKIMLIR